MILKIVKHLSHPSFLSLRNVFSVRKTRVRESSAISKKSRFWLLNMPSGSLPDSKPQRCQDDCFNGDPSVSITLSVSALWNIQGWYGVPWRWTCLIFIRGQPGDPRPLRSVQCGTATSSLRHTTRMCQFDDEKNSPLSNKIFYTKTITISSIWPAYIPKGSSFML